MPASRAHALSSRTLAALALLVLLAVGFLASMPTPVAAYGLIETETFYSDATFSSIVGRCIENSCLGTYSCSGTISDFSKVTVRGCAGSPPNF